MRPFSWILSRLSILGISILVLMGGGRVAAVEFDKVDGRLSYWYWVYFDIGYLEKLADSLSKQQPVTQPDGSIDLPLSPDWISDYGNVSGSPIKLLNGVPYVTASLGYNGDGADLSAIGVIYSVFAKESAIVVFPLENLPRLDSLPTVGRISSGYVDVAQTDNSAPKNEQSKDEINDVYSGTILVRLPKVESDHSLQFLLLYGSDKVVKVSRNSIYEYPSSDSATTDIALPVQSPGTYQLIIKCVGEDTWTLCYSGIEVVPDSACLVNVDGSAGILDSTKKIHFLEWIGLRKAVDDGILERVSDGE